MFIAYSLLALVSFASIWAGAGLIISAVNKLSTYFHVSKFAFSFFVLGFLTSVPELAIGLNAIANKEPEIFVGNLLGGVVVLFLLIIPILAIAGRKITLVHQLRKKNLLTTLAVIAAPALLLLDRKITNTEAVLLLALFVSLFYVVPVRSSLIANVKHLIQPYRQKFDWHDWMKLAGGVALVFVASHFIVNSTNYFSNFFSISPFIISLLVLSVGTNLPELVLGVRSVVSGSKEVALGDYLGSAAYNGFLLAFLSLINNGEVLTSTSFGPTFIATAFGVLLFYMLTVRDSILSRHEGILLLTSYMLFILVEFFYT